jgi:hypothetical protein
MGQRLGMSYADVLALPRHVYDIADDELRTETPEP